MKLTTIALMGTFLLSGIVSAKTVNLDKTSRIGFSIIKFKIGAPVEGKFDSFTGSADYDAKKNVLKDVKATIQAKSINTDNEKRDGHLRTPDFFDTDNHPTISFVSTGKDKIKDKFKMKGKLTIKGVTEKVQLEMKKVSEDAKTIVLEGTGVIDRLKYGITWNKALEKSKWTKVLGVLGKTVLDKNVTLKLKLVVKK